MSDSWVSVEEGARRVHRSKRTVYQWIQDGLVRSWRPGRSLRVNLPDLRRVEGEQKQGRPRTKDLT